MKRTESMAEHFNRLTPAEAERLAMLSEECGEVVQIVGKILRHGYESHHPDSPDLSNRDLLAKELADVHSVTDRMVFDGDMRIGQIESNYTPGCGSNWSEKKRYTHHQ